MQRILVVDDERLVADTLRLIFSKHGFEAKAAYSTAEAVQCALEFQPELVLCDIVMPGEDGIELIQQVSRRLPQCRFLVLTGRYSTLKRVHDETRGMLQPANILTKPCQPADLLREAGAILARA